MYPTDTSPLACGSVSPCTKIPFVMLSVLAVPAAMADPAMNPTSNSAIAKTHPLFKPFISMPPFRHVLCPPLADHRHLRHLCSRLPHHLPPSPPPRGGGGGGGAERAER